MCAVRGTLCVSGIVRAVHQSFTKLGDTPLARLDLLESLPSRRFGCTCRASTTNSAAKSRSTSLYNGGALSRGGCRALQLYSAPERSTSLQLYSALHSTSSTPSLRFLHALPGLVGAWGEIWHGGALELSAFERLAATARRPGGQKLCRSAIRRSERAGGGPPPARSAQYLQARRWGAPLAGND